MCDPWIESIVQDVSAGENSIQNLSNFSLEDFLYPSAPSEKKEHGKQNEMQMVSSGGCTNNNASSNLDYESSTWTELDSLLKTFEEFVNSDHSQDAGVDISLKGGMQHNDGLSDESCCSISPSKLLLTHKDQRNPEKPQECSEVIVNSTDILKNHAIRTEIKLTEPGPDVSETQRVIDEIPRIKTPTNNDPKNRVIRASMLEIQGKSVRVLKNSVKRFIRIPINSKRLENSSLNKTVSTDTQESGGAASINVVSTSILPESSTICTNIPSENPVINTSILPESSTISTNISANTPVITSELPSSTTKRRIREGQLIRIPMSRLSNIQVDKKADARIENVITPNKPAENVIRSIPSVSLPTGSSIGHTNTFTGNRGIIGTASKQADQCPQSNQEPLKEVYCQHTLSPSNFPSKQADQCPQSNQATLKKVYCPSTVQQTVPPTTFSKFSSKNCTFTRVGYKEATLRASQAIVNIPKHPFGIKHETATSSKNSANAHTLLGSSSRGALCTPNILLKRKTRSNIIKQAFSLALSSPEENKSPKVMVRQFSVGKENGVAGFPKSLSTNYNTPREETKHTNLKIHKNIVFVKKSSIGGGKNVATSSNTGSGTLNIPYADNKNSKVFVLEKVKSLEEIPLNEETDSWTYSIKPKRRKI